MCIMSMNTHHVVAIWDFESECVYSTQPVRMCYPYGLACGE